MCFPKLPSGPAGPQHARRSERSERPEWPAAYSYTVPYYAMLTPFQIASTSLCPLTHTSAPRILVVPVCIGACAPRRAHTCVCSTLSAYIPCRCLCRHMNTIWRLVTTVDCFAFSAIYLSIRDHSVNKLILVGPYLYVAIVPSQQC
jgi:hypothetical protein